MELHRQNLPALRSLYDAAIPPGWPNLVTHRAHLIALRQMAESSMLGRPLRCDVLRMSPQQDFLDLPILGEPADHGPHCATGKPATAESRGNSVAHVGNVLAAAMSGDVPRQIAAGSLDDGEARLVVSLTKSPQRDLEVIGRGCQPFGREALNLRIP